VQGKKNSGPFGAIEKGASMKQVPIRVHRNDYEVAKAHMLRDKLNFQQMMSILFDAYVERDEYVLELLKRKSTVQKATMKGRFTLSEREQGDILDEIDDGTDD
jgi:hypothetical protein